MTDKTVPETILEQLGGGLFVRMTGARNILSDEGGTALNFRLPASFAKDGINAVKVTLVRDTYTVRFGKLGRAPRYKFDVIAELEGIYGGDLQRVFTHHTGLDTSL